jgi:hypothetical protein
VLRYAYHQPQRAEAQLLIYVSSVSTVFLSQAKTGFGIAVVGG